MKKLLALFLLCVLLTLSVTAACARRTPAVSTQTNDESGNAERESSVSAMSSNAAEVSLADSFGETGISDGAVSAPGDAEPETPEELLLSQLGNMDLGGFNCHILVSAEQDLAGQLAAEENKPDVLNTAVAERNELLETLYGFTLSVRTVEGCDELLDAVRTDLIAGLQTVNLFAGGAHAVGFLSIEGAAYDFAADEFDAGLRLDAPWWDGALLDALAVGGRATLLSGDVMLSSAERLEVLYCNQSLLREHGLTDPFALFEGGEWSPEALIRLCRDASAAGLTGMVGNESMVDGLMTAAGAPMLRLAEDGTVEPSEAEVLAERFAELFSLLSDESAWRYSRVYDYSFGCDADAPLDALFYGGEALFMIMPLGDADAEALRTMEDEYAILPLPSGDGANLSAPIDSHGYPVIALSVGAPLDDLPKAAAVLDALACYNHFYIEPQYRRAMLKRFGREAQAALIDELLDAQTADPVGVFDAGSSPLRFFSEALLDLEERENGLSNGDDFDFVQTAADRMAAFARMAADDIQYCIDLYND